MRTVLVSTRLLVTLICFGVAVLALSLMCATANADYTVSTCGQYANEGVWSELPAGTTFDFNNSACPSTNFVNGLVITANRAENQHSQQGHRAAWSATAPAGLEILGASSPVLTASKTGGYSVSAFWDGGTGAIASAPDQSLSWSGFASPFFGFQIGCDATTCPTSDQASLYVNSVQLDVHETTPPSLDPGAGLWDSQGWVRGQWPLSVTGSSPSGMCELEASFNGDSLTTSVSGPRDPATWAQCSAPPLITGVNTAPYGSGPMQLEISGFDADGETTDATKMIEVDNSTPTLSLSGPTDVPTSAGTPYVTASAGGSPSGIDGIGCSADNGPTQWYPGSSAQVPVSGLGEHEVSCNAYNNAVDASGVHGESATQTWSLKIGYPTVLGAGFRKYVGLRCHAANRRETIRGHWVIRTRYGKKVKVKTRTRHKIVKVTKCHPKTKRVRVVERVPLRRHGKIVRRHGKVMYRKKLEHKRVVVTPHWKSKAIEHVRHGHATTVSGWLGLSDGTAVPGQPVEILSAPANGLEHFRVATIARTATDGTWTADLPPGPSRIVEASYPGGAITEPAVSGQVKVVVPSRIKIKSVIPTRVAWGQSVTIKGKLSGGYLPAGGVNVRLRIGIGDAKATYGVQEHVAGDGRFTTTYTFGAGDARIHRRYWFQIATLPSGNYPYGTSSSNRIYVDVGGHPPRARKHRHRH